MTSQGQVEKYKPIAVKWADHLKFSPEWEDYLTLVAELALLIAECEQVAEEACCRRMCHLCAGHGEPEIDAIPVMECHQYRDGREDSERCAASPIREGRAE